MSERLFDTTQERAMELIEGRTLNSVDERYSTGYPDYRGGQDGGLLFHNGYHARMVGGGALRVGGLIGLSADELRISKLSGFAHDYYQGKGHEQKSAAWLEEQLRREGLPKPVAYMAGMAIRGTQPIFHNGVIVGQVATEQTYTSLVSEKIALAVASADLGSLYTSMGPLVAHDLYRELRQENDPAIDEALLAFQRQQVQMLESYRYPLQEADRLLATHRPQVMAYSYRTLNQLERGEIEDWSQLRAQDVAFHHRLS
jgi:hypothetical protein